MDAKLLFIVGAQKTATSTTLGIVNLYDAVYIEYELFINTKYKEKFLKTRPNLEFLFDIKNKSDFYKVYLEEISKLYEHRYKYIGDKFISINFEDINEFRENKIIYTFRDIRTWLAKISTTGLYSNITVAELAYRYINCFIRAFTLPDCLMIRLEELVIDEISIRNKIDKYLGINNVKQTELWWGRIGLWDKNNPKYSSMWWSGHRTSRVPPKKFDIDINIKEHEMWNIIMPIFGKYVSYYKSNKKPDLIEIESDLKIIETIKNIECQYDDLYDNIEFIPLFKRKKPKK